MSSKSKVGKFSGQLQKGNHIFNDSLMNISKSQLTNGL